MSEGVEDTYLGDVPILRQRASNAMGSLAPAIGFGDGKEKINVLITGFGVRRPSKNNSTSLSF